MNLDVKFVKHPENDMMKATKGIAILFELAGPFNPEKPNSKYWLRCHKCNLSANLGDHDVKIIDGIITINPSIECPNTKCNNHYYIKNGKVVL